MKVVLITFLLLPLLLVSAEDSDFTKIETLINANAKQLQKEDVSSSGPLDKKRSADLANEIQAGNCPASIDENIMSPVIKRLIISKLDIEQAKTSFDCIDSAGFEKEKYYSLMVDFLPSWDSNNIALKLFYIRYFKNYKKPNITVLGLLDNAKLMCAETAISYLETNNYPANLDKSMTKKEYTSFEEYIKEYRCEGY